MPPAIQQHASQVRALLRFGPANAQTLIEQVKISQPTFSRAIRALGDEVLFLGVSRSVRYAIQDASRSELQTPVYRVTEQGMVETLGTLIPVCPHGFVMDYEDGKRVHSDGLPWWMTDLLPQGYLGRVFAQRHSKSLNLPERISDWSDAHHLRTLLDQGNDLAGDLLLGRKACEHFINAPTPQPIARKDITQAYVQLAHEAENGDVAPWVGGEMPKFTAFVQSHGGEASHVIVKFSPNDHRPASQRWRDLLLAESFALQVLAECGLDASSSDVLNSGPQRFLEIQRFDRAGALGRRSVHTLASLDAEFAGCGGSWPATTKVLERAGVITTQAMESACLLWAYGTLIGNTDMHSGNLAFWTDTSSPYTLGPAYDMTPMAFAPTPAGALPECALPLNISESITGRTWHRALALAQNYVQRLSHSQDFSADFAPCIATLQRHVAEAGARIGRLAK